VTKELVPYPVRVAQFSLTLMNMRTWTFVSHCSSLARSTKVLFSPWVPGSRHARYVLALFFTPSRMQVEHGIETCKLVQSSTPIGAAPPMLLRGACHGNYSAFQTGSVCVLNRKPIISTLNFVC